MVSGNLKIGIALGFFVVVPVAFISLSIAGLIVVTLSAIIATLLSLSYTRPNTDSVLSRHQASHLRPQPFAVFSDFSAGYFPRFEGQSLSSLLDKFQDCEVIRKFTGKSKEKHDLRNFTEWYSQDIVQQLVISHQDSANAVCVVFSHRDFFHELTQLKMLINNLQKPGIFISMEPGSGQNHFILGVIHQNKLLLVNPVGTTSHKDFYASVHKLFDTQLFTEVFLSETKIQHDPQGLVSCGPICVALSQHLSQSNIEGLFEKLRNSVQNKSNQEKYHRVNLREYLPPSLQAIVDLQGNYQENIEKLRQSHLYQLLLRCQEIGNQTDIDEYFDKALNTNAQIVLRKLVLGDISILDLDETPEFICLQDKRVSWQKTKLK